MDLWQTWCMRWTENPENVVQFHEGPQLFFIPVRKVKEWVQKENFRVLLFYYICINKNNAMLDLKDFINEAVSVKKIKNDIQKLYDEDGDLMSILSCWEWLEDLNWELKTKKEYAKYINDVNDAVSELYAKNHYCDCVIAMASLGKEATYKLLKDEISSESELKDFGIKL